MGDDGPFVLALDLGSSSARGILFDLRARPVLETETRASVSVRTAPDADELVRRAEEVVDGVLARAGARPIAAVACCTFWHSLIGLDAQGRPRTPVQTWADASAEPYTKVLRERLDEKEYHARTGAFFHPVYHPARLLAHQGTDGIRTWVSLGEYLHLRLFGRAIASVSMASATGLLNVHTCDWDGPTLGALGVSPQAFSPLGDVGDALTGLREPYASRWPALRNLRWFPPVGDGACNNLGSGCSGRDRIGVMVGTSGAMRISWPAERWEIPWGLWGYRADRRRVVLGGALNDGGNLVEWCRATLRLGSAEEVERELALMEPDRHGLTFLPFLAGERSPGWAADARAAILGLTLRSRPVEILRAGMEAVALRFALIHEMIGRAVPEAGEVVASGGALRASPAWVQMVADALGRPVRLPKEPEASARGAVLLALEAMGVVSRLEELPAALGEAVEPDPRRTALYRGALERQKGCYRQLVRS